MNLGLAETTALVLGASAGLGLATAEALAEEGANIVIFARNADVLEREAQRIGGTAVSGDVRQGADIERAVQTAVDTYGGLDIVVANGGGPPPGRASELQANDFESAFQLLMLPMVGPSAPTGKRARQNRLDRVHLRSRADAESGPLERDQARRRRIHEIARQRACR